MGYDSPWVSIAVPPSTRWPEPGGKFQLRFLTKTWLIGVFTTKFLQQGKEMCKTVHLCGKLPGRLSIAMAVSLNKICLLYAWDHHSGCHFLLDTGAEASIFSATTMDRNSPCQGIKLAATNRSNICTYGEHTIPLKFNKRYLKWTFAIAQVSQPLLEAYFLRLHSLLVDIKGQCLIDSFNLTSITLRSTYAAVPHLGSIASVEDDFTKLLAFFPDLTISSFANLSLKYEVELFILQWGHPSMHVHIGYQLAFGQGVIQENGRGRHNPSLRLSVGLTSSHGTQTIRWLAALRRLPSPKWCHHTWPLPVLHIQDFTAILAGMSLLKDWSDSWFLPDPYTQRISLRQLSSHLSVYGNFSACPLAKKMQHNLSKGSWTRSYRVLMSHLSTSMISPWRVTLNMSTYALTTGARMLTATHSHR